MKILAIETSCDETAAAIVSKNPQENYVKILSNVVASSLAFHSQTGGIVPDIAAREQLKFIIPIVKQSLIESNLYPLSSKIDLLSSTIYRPDIDAIAVTVAPGLIGSLLIGVETAKSLAYLWNKPIIPVNHLLGHIYANWIKVSKEGKVPNVSNGEPKTPFDTSDTLQPFDTPKFPCLALLVSGGHTDLVLLKNHKKITWIGGTLDDAAGEAFDKIGRLLNLPYPGGPSIEKASERGDFSRFTFPRPMIGSKDFNFSFSGLKAAVSRHVILNKVKNLGDPSASPQDDIIVPDIAASVQQAIIDVLVRKTVKAAKKYGVKSILLGGGVASNQKLRDELELNARRYMLDAKIFCPPKNLCTDNAAMIGAYAAFHYKPIDWKKVTADPQLYF